MSNHFVFISYRAEIAWVARLARELRRRRIESDLWIVDPVERGLGEKAGAFRAVVDLRGDYTRTPVNGARPAGAEVLHAAAALEDELGFGPFLHREAGVDRIMTGTNHLHLPPMRMAHRWRWEEVCELSTRIAATVRERLRADQPIAVVGEASMFSARVVARVVLAEGVRFLNPFNLPYLPGRIQFADGFEGQWTRCVEAYAALADAPIPADAADAARASLEAIRAGVTLTIPRESVGDYLGTPRARFSPRRVTNLGMDWRDAKNPEAIASPHNSYPELLSPHGRLVRKVRRRLVREAFDREAVAEIPDSPFVAYFIHAQPEVTVEGWAFEFQDQVATIRNIATGLPADVLLVVKEHRIQAGWRDSSFYKELHSIPGVVVLSDVIPSSLVVRQTEMVLTLTGTIAMEAMCVGVPAVVLGSVYYEHFTGVERASSWAHLRRLVAERHAFALASDEDCLRALASRHLASYPGGWMSGGRGSADEAVTVDTLLTEAAA